ncbi:probable N-acetyltransferase camello [Oncorhynchus kisutch]|uniref:probable N-acetyltransferase camello n=1 Tax=Oncorhynchus kisutch TaxID=8019 RepID=UPI0012DCFE4B|nr:probable N-acetyltransferase camello [Oncorhynchus kisutch]
MSSLLPAHDGLDLLQGGLDLLQGVLDLLQGGLDLLQGGNRVRTGLTAGEDWTCFWVAESDGWVVATVACLPAEREPGCMELKRLSVRRTHRRMGIAKALSRTVADFSRERGFPAVVLYTSVVQTDAQRLYENVGYTQVREFVIPEPIAKITNFTLIEFKLDLLQRGK